MVSETNRLKKVTEKFGSYGETVYLCGIINKSREKMTVTVYYRPESDEIYSEGEIPPYEDPIKEEMDNVDDFTFSANDNGDGKFEMKYEMRSGRKVNARTLTVESADCDVRNH